MAKGLADDNLLYNIFYKYGFHFLRKNYYLPIPEESDISYMKQSELVGIDMNENLSFNLLTDVIAKYKGEFNEFPINQTDNLNYYLLNGSFMAIDGNVYYSLIRFLKPKKIVEIGAGYSTLLASKAILKNKEGSEESTQLICIEPYPGDILTNLSGLSKLMVHKVQDIGLDFFESLGPGDILFIDSSHALRSGGDVWWEYCEILPRLASGVYVHIHDISLPKPYPRVYFDNHTYWNEQYLLQAFLTFNSKFEVIWGGNYLMCKYPEKIRAAFLPEYDFMRTSYPSSEPTSFWIKVR